MKTDKYGIPATQNPTGGFFGEAARWHVCPSVLWRLAVDEAAKIGGLGIVEAAELLDEAQGLDLACDVVGNLIRGMGESEAVGADALGLTGYLETKGTMSSLLSFRTAWFQTAYQLQMTSSPLVFWVLSRDTE